MYYESELHFLQKILDKCHLKNIIFNPELPMNFDTDMGLKKLFKAENQQNFYHYFPEVKLNSVYRLSDSFFFNYIFLRLPTDKEECIFLIGPYLKGDVERQNILELGERLGISPANLRELESVYTALPIIYDEKHIFAMVNSFAEFLWNSADGLEYIDVNREYAAFMPIDYRLADSQANDEVNILDMEKRYKFENELIKAVELGNMQRAEFMMSNFSTLVFENRSTNPLRNLKNYCIIMNTLLRKAAESGGVHPVYIDKLSSKLAHKIEGIHSISQMPVVMLEIMRRYCKLVQSYSFKNYSKLVQNIIIKIENGLTKDLSLKNMARENNISSGYLSSLFKRETGRTYTDFVNLKRIDYAKYLLKSTNLQVQTVAQHCGILDLNYFCRLFKSHTGSTPTQYRDSISAI